MPYCLKITSKHKFNSLLYSALQIWQKYIIKINFTTDFVSAAAEIEQIVKLKINFTIDFGPTAAEIEQIVKLIEIIKRNIQIIFIFSINFTICSISAAVGLKLVVKLIFNFTISSISAAV